MNDQHVINQRIGAAIRAARGRRGIKQDELAPLLGVGRSTLARYETGQRALSAAMLVQLCQVLDESLDSLLPGLTGAHTTHAGLPVAPALLRIVQQLQQHPELVGTVQELLETMGALEEATPG